MKYANSKDCVNGLEKDPSSPNSSNPKATRCTPAINKIAKKKELERWFRFTSKRESPTSKSKSPPTKNDSSDNKIHMPKSKPKIYSMGFS